MANLRLSKVILSEDAPKRAKMSVNAATVAEGQINRYCSDLSKHRPHYGYNSKPKRNH